HGPSLAALVRVHLGGEHSETAAHYLLSEWDEIGADSRHEVRVLCFLRSRASFALGLDGRPERLAQRAAPQPEEIIARELIERLPAVAAERHRPRHGRPQRSTAGASYVTRTKRSGLGGAPREGALRFGGSGGSGASRPCAARFAGPLLRCRRGDRA